MSTNRRTHRVYVRALPASGFVAIDVRHQRSLFPSRRYHGALVVERRAQVRSEGHAAPVIAEAWGKSMESVLEQLLPSAQYDPAIGAALLRRRPI